MVSFSFEILAESTSGSRGLTLANLSHVEGMLAGPAKRGLSQSHPSKVYANAFEFCLYAFSELYASAFP